MPRKMGRSIAFKRKLDFTGLVDAVRQVCERSAPVASRAVNVSLTLRNWLVGFYIVEYEQRGSDRAQYGERLGIWPWTIAKSKDSAWPEPIWRSLTAKFCPMNKLRTGSVGVSEHIVDGMEDI